MANNPASPSPARSPGTASQASATARGYVDTVYDGSADSIVFLLFRDQGAAQRHVPLGYHSAMGRRPQPCYLPLEVDLRRFVDPGQVTDWPVRIAADHPGYSELRQQWFDTIQQRGQDAWT